MTRYVIAAAVLLWTVAALFYPAILRRPPADFPAQTAP